MSLFGGSTSAFGSSGVFSAGGTSGAATAPTGNVNPMKDIEVTSPPDDSVSALAFSPGSLPSTFLVAGSWDSHIRCWEVQQTGQTVPKAQQTHAGPVLDVAWSDVSLRVLLLNPAS